MENFYIVVHNKGPVQALSSECVVFSKKKEAQLWIKEQKEKGERLVYGRDEFDMAELKIQVLHR